MDRDLESYYWYKEHGICVKCKQEDAYKGIMCLACKMDERKKPKKRYPEKNAAYQAELRAKRKAEHKCVYCGRDLYKWDDRVACGVCRAKQNAQKRQKSRIEGRVPQYFRGDGYHCAICYKLVENKGDKLCARCYKNCLNNLAKTTPEGRERATKTFREYNTIYWNERKEWNK